MSNVRLESDTDKQTRFATGKSRRQLFFCIFGSLSVATMVLMLIGDTYLNRPNRLSLSKREPNPTNRSQDIQENSGVHEWSSEVETLLRYWILKNTTNDKYAEEKRYQHDDQYHHYMKCPTSIHRKMLKIPEMQDIYIPDMPILMWNEHMSRVVYDRLSRYTGKNGFRNISFEVISDAMETLKSPNNRYLFDDRLVNGMVPNDDACIRCAVVGNGGILNGSRKGKEIDGHDYVFRVNLAVIKGHEADVGSRTSFYCSSFNSMISSYQAGRKFGYTVPADDGIRYVIFGKRALTYEYLNASLRGEPKTRIKQACGRMLPFPKDITADDIKLTHPDFMRYIKWSWVNSKHQHKEVNGPTTGGLMMILAIHTCDEVNAYGFGSYNVYSEYYYDKVFKRHTFVANHDAKMENTLWNQLEDLGIIKLYKRD